MVGLECKDRYDRLAKKFLDDNTAQLVKLGVFDGRPDAHFIRNFVPALGAFLRAEMPEVKRPGRPRKIDTDRVA